MKQTNLKNIKELLVLKMYNAKYKDKEIIYSKEYHFIRNELREIPQIRIIRFGNSLEDEIPTFLLKKIIADIENNDIDIYNIRMELGYAT